MKLRENQYFQTVHVGPPENTSHLRRIQVYLNKCFGWSATEARGTPAPEALQKIHNTLQREDKITLLVTIAQDGSKLIEIHE